ncbi:MAG: hypothetical protein K1W13_03015 [Lachnospiraceae bacterium]
MFWRLVIKILKCRKSGYSKYIKLGKDIYVIKIYRHVSIDELLEMAANNNVFTARESKEGGG